MKANQWEDFEESLYRGQVTRVNGRVKFIVDDGFQFLLCLVEQTEGGVQCAAWNYENITCILSWLIKILNVIDNF